MYAVLPAVVNSVMLCSVCQVVHVSLQISEALLPFNYTNPSPSLVYHFLTIHLFYSTNPSPTHLCTLNPVWCPPQRLRHIGRKRKCIFCLVYSSHNHNYFINHEAVNNFSVVWYLYPTHQSWEYFLSFLFQNLSCESILKWHIHK